MVISSCRLELSTRSARCYDLSMKEPPPLTSRVRRLLRRLKRLYPDASSELDFDNPLQLLVATILTTQCTDVRVNQVTPALFQKYPTVDAFADVHLKELQRDIKSTGFYRNKARNIKKCCQIIRDQHQGEVPSTMEDLVKLPGIGRKIANCILGDAFGIPGITVDTHVGRLSRRLGLTEHTDAVKAEHDLMAIIPRPQWTPFSHRMILHGRRVCVARKPKCADCTLNDICPKVGVEKR